MVLIIVNDATPAEAGTGTLGASEYTGLYYAQARRIPLENVFHIKTRTPSDPHNADSWSIGWDEFESRIRAPLRTFLERDGLKDRIKYIVTTYGVPSHIRSYKGYENLSVDSFLASVFSPASDEVSAPNPAFAADPRRMPRHWPPSDGIYAVTRLDGPSADLAVSLVERALRAERGITRASGIGYFDYGGLSGSAAGAISEESVRRAAALCQEAGMDCQLTDRSETKAGISAPNALWAWGSPAENLPPGDYTFAPGAVGAQLTPDSAATIRSTATGAWVPLWVTGGITATWGATSQPYANLYANGDNLLNHLWSGYSFGEAAYLAAPSLNWKMVFLGDPLYAPVLTDAVPGRKGAPPQSEGRFADPSLETEGRRGESQELLRSTVRMETQAAGTMSLSIGSGTTTPGGAVAINLTLDSAGGTPPAALQWSFDASADITSVTVVAGSTATAAQKSVECGGGTCVVYGLNANTIADGVVAIATFQVASSPSTTTIPLQISGVVAASETGESLSLDAVSGVLTAVPAPAPSAVSVSPNSGTGASQSFTFTFSDAQSAANLTGMGVLFSTSPSTFANACYLFFDGTAQRLSLRWDNATGEDSRAVASSSTLQNSQCSVGVMTLTTSALSQVITVSITFKPVFNGAKNIYMYASDYALGLSTGWVQNGTWTAANATPLPSAVSESPSSGSGASQSFTFTFSDAQSVANLTGMGMLFSTSPGTFANSCYLFFDGTAQQLSLRWDNSAGEDSRAVASSATLQNSQCSVGAMTLTPSALSQVITVSITFKPAFNGPKNIYMYASDYALGLNTGWVQKGAWTAANVIPPLPSAVSVSPTSGSGPSQSFTFTFSDAQSAANLTGMGMLFSTSSSTFANACYLFFDGTAQRLSLRWDNAVSEDSRAVASSTTLQNSQCSVGAMTLTTSALTQVITVSITFKPAFYGAKNTYMYASDYALGLNTGWVQKGAWTANAAPLPSVDSVSPSSGNGASQSFTFTFSDAQSVANLTGMGMLFSTSPTTFANACYLFYDGTAQRLSLRWDNATGEDSRAVASSTTLQNSQCSAGAMTLTTSTLSQVITVSITFKAAFNGAKNIYMYASDYALGLNTGWVQKGTWIAANAIPLPSAVSVSPSSGSGASQNFTFTFSDAQSVANLTGMGVLFSTSASTFANACYLFFDGTAQRLSLRWDNAAGEDSRAVASSTTLQNSQCSVGVMTLTPSALSQVIAVSVTFKPVFTGAKNIYMYASDYALGLNTGWVQKGTWTAP